MLIHLVTYTYLTFPKVFQLGIFPLCLWIYN